MVGEPKKFTFIAKCKTCNKRTKFTGDNPLSYWSTQIRDDYPSCPRCNTEERPWFYVPEVKQKDNTISANQIKGWYRPSSEIKYDPQQKTRHLMVFEVDNEDSGEAMRVFCQHVANKKDTEKDIKIIRDFFNLMGWRVPNELQEEIPPYEPSPGIIFKAKKGLSLKMNMGQGDP